LPPSPPPPTSLERRRSSSHGFLMFFTPSNRGARKKTGNQMNLITVENDRSIPAGKAVKAASVQSMMNSLVSRTSPPSTNSIN